MHPTPYKQHLTPCPAALKCLRARNDLFDLYNRCGISDLPVSTSQQLHLNQLLNWGFRINTVATDHWILTPPGSNSRLHLYGEQELASYTGHQHWQHNQHSQKPSPLKGNDNNDRKETA